MQGEPYRVDDVTVYAEKQRRETLWDSLTATGDMNALPPSALKSLRVYDGGRGIWTDKGTTAGIGGADAVTVAILHTGARYPDDLSEEALLYHYPETRQLGRDAMEIAATKAAGHLQLPIFVIIKSGNARTVKRGWVTDWDDRSQLFLVEFAPKSPAASGNDPDAEAAFELHQPPAKGRRTVRARPNQQRFRLAVFKRYGTTCALCNVDAPELLTAAHIVPVERRGSDDPRNGLVLCWNHHRAFDLGFIRIDDCGVVHIEGRYSADDLAVVRPNLDHLNALPAREALAAEYERGAASRADLPDLRRD